MAREARDWAEFGLIGNRPRVDIRAALARAESAVNVIYELLHTSDLLRAEGIEVEEGIGPVHFVDAQTLAVAGGRTVMADRIILAVEGTIGASRFPAPNWHCPFAMCCISRPSLIGSS